MIKNPYTPAINEQRRTYFFNAMKKWIALAKEARVNGYPETVRRLRLKNAAANGRVFRDLRKEP